jgi:hypothetical protein
MNGNDAIGLLKTETGNVEDAVAVDLFGVIGEGIENKKETTIKQEIDS